MVIADVIRLHKYDGVKMLETLYRAVMYTSGGPPTKSQKISAFAMIVMYREQIPFPIVPSSFDNMMITVKFNSAAMNLTKNENKTGRIMLFHYRCSRNFLKLIFC